MTTPMIPVQSSQISYIGYDKDVRELFITFTNGTTFVYYRVPDEVFNELKSSSSVGKYFNSNIKNTYANSKVK